MIKNILGCGLIIVGLLCYFKTCGLSMPESDYELVRQSVRLLIDWLVVFGGIVLIKD